MKKLKHDWYYLLRPLGIILVVIAMMMFYNFNITPINYLQSIIAVIIISLGITFILVERDDKK